MIIRNKIPYILFISEDNLIYSGKIEYLLTIKELELIVNACNKTIDIYKEKNISDIDIEIENNKQLQKEYKSIGIKFEKIKETYIYIMYDENSKYFKIGRSVNPQKREKTLQSEKPSIVLLYTFKGVNNDEIILHEKFKSKRIRGEWFNLNDDDITEIHKYFNS